MTLSCASILGRPAPTPAPTIPAYDWLLDSSAFPSSWENFPCDPDCGRAERPYEALRSFGRVKIPGHVIQQVFYFGSERSAKAKFQLYEGSDLSEATPSARSPFSPFQPPPEISYRSPIADEQYLGCGVDVVPGCRAGLRYGQYFIYFYFDIDGGKGDGLQIEEVEPILRAMDERASLLLGIPLEAENP